MADDVREKIGARITKARESLAISQGELARRLGVRPETVNRYESGKMVPSAEILPALADVLQTSIDRLLRGDEHLQSRVELDAHDSPVAPSELLERVIDDMELDDEIAAELRGTQWKTGVPSEATLRSYAVDLRGKKKGKLREPSAAPQPNPGLAPLKPTKRKS